MKKKTLLFFLFLGSITAAGAESAVRLADVGWDSIKINNAIVKCIGEKVFGYKVEEVPGSTPIIHEALKTGDIDVVMEEWTSNIANYEKDLKDGGFVELGINFDDNYQGFYIPEFTQEAHPDLKNVHDLARFADVFKNRIYGGIPGWGVTTIMEKKVQAYHLDGAFEYILPGSNAAMDTTIISAIDDKKDIVFYYWEPTYLMGKYDFVLLEDSPYNADTYLDGIGALPSVPVTKAVSNQFYKNNPDFCAFISKFALPSKEISKLLAYKEENKCDFTQTALHFITAEEKTVRGWLTEKDAAVLYAENSGKQDKKKLFPWVLNINEEKIDNGIRQFAKTNKTALSSIQTVLDGIVNGIYALLARIPWFVLALLIFALSFLGKRKILKSAGLVCLFLAIGVLGLYGQMLTTLAIVITSVILSLILGLSVGILIANSPLAHKIIQPVLDTMQTMPVFVYLIPALLLFGMGNAASVIATVIYAVVPAIRLTSLGIKNVDAEIVEAARSFGASPLQTLIKVQIPQGLPTIATGINQTLMMAMAMVVTCSMIGARGLGLEVLNAVNRIEIGRGLLSGTAVVILAIVLDRITMGFVKKEQKHDKQ